MTDTSSQIAMRPPRLEEGYSRPTAPERERFFGTARSMAAPALEAARGNLEASRGGVGAYLANMPLAALNLADAAVRGGVGAFADLIPGLRPAAERDLAREVLAVPEAFAGSAARVPDALDEGLGGLSEVARRMFQEGPVPDRLMAGVDPEEFLRLMRGRRDAAEAQRLREDLDANDQLRAERGLPPLNPVPRTADPDAVLADFSAAREAMLGASRDMSFAELQALSGAQAAARDAAVAALSDAPTVRLFDRNNRAVVVGPGMGPGEEGRFRVTYFDADRQPSNHTVYETREEALGAALREGFDSRTAAPAPRDFGFRQDNPALSRGDTEWLANKQRVAEETYGERRGITGSTTAQLGQSTDMFLPTDFLRRIPGLNRENRRPGDPKYDDLLRDVQERGFLPDQDRNRVVLGVNHRGEPFLVEGNTRVAVASDVGVPNVRVEVIYKNGGEMVDGPFSPENVARIAARGPASSFQSTAQGAVVRPQLGEPFDDWIDRIYAPENRGPENRVQDPNVVFRAMSPEEASFGETEGVFRDVSGAPLYVANDPERYVGGGAYGGRNRGRIYEFDVTDIPSETRAGGVGITERAVSAIPAERVRRIWEWDPDRGSHVLIEDRTAGPRPENFAQGGVVRGGIGSLSEVARGMFRA